MMKLIDSTVMQAVGFRRPSATSLPEADKGKATHPADELLMECHEPTQDEDVAQPSSREKTARRWNIDVLAHAFSQNSFRHTGRELKDAIRRVPYHGLWAGAKDFKPKQTIIYAQIGQDLVRSLNSVLGQYSTAEQLGAYLRHAYQDSCRQCQRVGVSLKVLGQEYNMVFLRSYGSVTVSQAHQIQEIFNQEVWKKVRAYMSYAAEHSPAQRDALQAIENNLDANLPLINLGMATADRWLGKSVVDQMARTAIAASAAAKRARLKKEGVAFAEAHDIVSALAAYRQMLDDHRHAVVEGQAVVLEAPNGKLMLSPTVLALHRAKQLPDFWSRVLGEAVGLLNCLDWVQQSRFTDLAKLEKQARIGRKMLRAIKPGRQTLYAEEVRSFARQHVPYLAVAEALTVSDGTLYWVDMKKLAVRCHIIREAEAMSLLDRLDAGEDIDLAHIVDAMIQIDLRVQDARDVLTTALRLIAQYFRDNGLECDITHHIGGDDAAFFVTHQGRSLDTKVAVGLGRHLSVHTEQLRVAHCNVPKGSNVADELCRIDRILTATKID